MNTYLSKQQKRSFIYRIFSTFLSFTFIFSLIFPPQVANAQMVQQVFNLPAPGMMLAPSNAYQPTIIHALTIDPDNPFRFTFIVAKGDANLQGEEFKEETKELIKYFLASLTVPEDEVWVNLSPYEEDRIIPEGLGLTDMGRDMLAQDYILKQLTASLVYPEDELGKKFWERVNKRAQQEFGTTEIPMNTFNKVWIMPESATVYEHDGTVFVVENRLKVMLEEDYLALQKNIENKSTSIGSAKGDENVASGVSSEVVREIVIPELEREVNEGKHFAKLRQIYNSNILALWYKYNLKESVLTQVYANQNKTKGIDVDDPKVKDKIYNQYVQAFKQGVFDYIKEDYDPNSQTVVAKKYFSGGTTLLPKAPKEVDDTNVSPSQMAAAAGGGMSNGMVAVEAGVDELPAAKALAGVVEESDREIADAIAEATREDRTFTPEDAENFVRMNGEERGKFADTVSSDGEKLSMQAALSNFMSARNSQGASQQELAEIEELLKYFKCSNCSVNVMTEGLDSIPVVAVTEIMISRALATLEDSENLLDTLEENQQAQAKGIVDRVLALESFSLSTGEDNIHRKSSEEHEVIFNNVLQVMRARLDEVRNDPERQLERFVWEMMIEQHQDALNEVKQRDKDFFFINSLNNSFLVNEDIFLSGKDASLSGKVALYAKVLRELSTKTFWSTSPNPEFYDQWVDTTLKWGRPDIDLTGLKNLVERLKNGNVAKEFLNSPGKESFEFTINEEIFWRRTPLSERLSAIVRGYLSVMAERYKDKPAVFRALAVAALTGLLVFASNQAPSGWVGVDQTPSNIATAVAVNQDSNKATAEENARVWSSARVVNGIDQLPKEPTMMALGMYTLDQNGNRVPLPYNIFTNDYDSNDLDFDAAIEVEILPTSTGRYHLPFIPGGFFVPMLKGVSNSVQVVIDNEIQVIGSGPITVLFVPLKAGSLSLANQTGSAGLDLRSLEVFEGQLREMGISDSIVTLIKNAQSSEGVVDVLRSSLVGRDAKEAQQIVYNALYTYMIASSNKSAKILGSDGTMYDGQGGFGNITQLVIFVDAEGKSHVFNIGELVNQPVVEDFSGEKLERTFRKVYNDKKNIFDANVVNLFFISEVEIPVTEGMEVGQFLVDLGFSVDWENPSVAVQRFLELNGFESFDAASTIFTGERLKLPGFSYAVESGDTLSEIAEEFGVSANVLRVVNKLASDEIFAGQVLKVPALTELTSLSTDVSLLRNIAETVASGTDIKSKRQFAASLYDFADAISSAGNLELASEMNTLADKVSNTCSACALAIEPQETVETFIKDGKRLESNPLIEKIDSQVFDATEANSDLLADKIMSALHMRVGNLHVDYFNDNGERVESPIESLQRQKKVVTELLDAYKKLTLRGYLPSLVQALQKKIDDVFDGSITAQVISDGLDEVLSLGDEYRDQKAETLKRVERLAETLGETMPVDLENRVRSVRLLSVVNRMIYEESGSSKKISEKIKEMLSQNPEVALDLDAIDRVSADQHRANFTYLRTLLENELEKWTPGGGVVNDGMRVYRELIQRVDTLERLSIERDSYPLSTDEVGLMSKEAIKRQKSIVAPLLNDFEGNSGYFQSDRDGFLIVAGKEINNVTSFANDADGNLFVATNDNGKVEVIQIFRSVSPRQVRVSDPLSAEEVPTYLLQRLGVKAQVQKFNIGYGANRLEGEFVTFSEVTVKDVLLEVMKRYPEAKLKPLNERGEVIDGVNIGLVSPASPSGRMEMINVRDLFQKMMEGYTLSLFPSIGGSSGKSEEALREEDLARAKALEPGQVIVGRDGQVQGIVRSKIFNPGDQSIAISIQWFDETISGLNVFTTKVDEADGINTPLEVLGELLAAAEIVELTLEDLGKINLNRNTINSSTGSISSIVGQDSNKQNLAPEQIEEVKKIIGSKDSPGQNSEAAVTDEFKKGGIDFNPAGMNLKIMRDERGVPLPFFKQPVSAMNVEGFYPVILNVAPINVPLLLGMVDEPSERSSSGELDAFDRLSAMKLDDV